MKAAPRTVYLVGAGPGDPGLLTLHARDLLATCDCIVYDALVAPEIMALANPKAERIYVGKRGSAHAVEQPDINRLLCEQAQAGKSVLRLKGGDPYLFGRGAEEALYLVGRGISVQVVPGITAGIAAPAYAGIPVTHRDHASVVAFVTGHEDPSKPESALDWAALAKLGTLCFYMGVKNLGRIAGELAKHRSPQTPAAVIQQGTTPRQRVVVGTLETIERLAREQHIQAPALTVVGDVVRYRDQLKFFEQTPLFGRRIVVTRARAQSSDLAAELSARGAVVYEFPTIRVAPCEDTRLAEAVAELAKGAYDWVILTSVNGVDALFAALATQGLDARGVRAKVAVIGSATATRLLEYGVRADLVPPEYVAEAIVAALQSVVCPPPLGGRVGREAEQGVFAGQRFLLPRADIARSALPEALTKLGGAVTDIAAYRTILETEGQEEALAALERGEIDAVTFTSASTARNFVEILGAKRLKQIVTSGKVRFFSIGPVTSDAMRAAGLPVHAEAAVHDIPALVKLIEEQRWE